MLGQRPTGRVGIAYERGRKLLRVLSVVEYRRGLRHGTAASIEHEGVPFNADVALVIDVGANRGQFSLLARHRWPTAEILAFEPHPTAADKLRRVMAHDRLTTIHQVALWDSESTVTLRLSNEDDSSSLLPIGDTYIHTWPNTFEVGRADVAACRLDSFSRPELPRPALLKIDVQGAELAVLRGAVSTLPQIDIVFIECSFAELYDGQALAGTIVSLLESHGLMLRGTYSAAYRSDGVCLQADLLFTRQPLV